MDNNQNFISFIRDSALICAFMILVPFIVAEICSIVAPKPERASLVTIEEKNDSKGYAEQNAVFEIEKKRADTVWFLIYFASGLALLILGFYTPTTVLTVGSIVAGMSCTLIGFSGYSGQINSLIRLLLLILIALIIAGLAYTFSKKNQ